MTNDIQLGSGLIKSTIERLQQYKLQKRKYVRNDHTSLLCVASL